jgi:hypothetical protein
MAQAPAWQIVPNGQALPQLPQLSELLSRLTHRLLPPNVQATSPAAQLAAHLPVPSQRAEAEQALPQAPQFAESLCRSTHSLVPPSTLQVEKGHVLTQLPEPSHCEPDEQAAPQAPQLRLSPSRSTQLKVPPVPVHAV